MLEGAVKKKILSLDEVEGQQAQGKPPGIVVSSGGSSGDSQQPVNVTVSEQWTGNTITRQTSSGKLTFVGWADPEKRFEVWRDESGKQYVRAVGSGAWFRGEDFAKAQAEAQKMLQQLNVVEVQTNPQLGSVTQRYFKEGDKWYTLQYDPQTNSYKKVEVPAEEIQQTVFDKLLGAPVNVSGYYIQDIEKYAQQAPREFVFYGALDAVRTARLKEIFPELADKGVSFADVRDAISSRLRKLGISPSYDVVNALAQTVLNNPDAWKDIEADLERQAKEYSQAISSYTDENKLKQLYEKLRQAPLNEDVRLLKQHRAMLLEKQSPQQIDVLPQVKSELQSILGGQLPDWSNLSPEQKNIISQYLMLSDPTLQKYIGDKVTLNLSQLTDDQRKILSRFISEDKIKGGEVTLSPDDAKKVLAGLLYMTLHPEELYAEQIKKQYGEMYGKSSYLPTTLASGIVSSSVTGAPPTPKQQNALDVGITSALRFGGLTDILGLAFKAPPSTGQVTGEILNQASEELRRQYVLNKVKEKGALGWWEAFGQDPYMALRVWWDPTAPGQFFGEINKQLSNVIQATSSQPFPLNLSSLPFVFAQIGVNLPATTLDFLTRVAQTTRPPRRAIEGFVKTVTGEKPSDEDAKQIVEKYGLDRFVVGWSGLSEEELYEVTRMIREGKIDKETLGTLMAIRDTIPKEVAHAYYLGDLLGIAIAVGVGAALKTNVKIDAPKGLKTVEDAVGWARRVFGDNARVFEENGKIKIEVPKGELLKFKLLDKLTWDIELPKNVVEKYGKDIGKLREQIAKNIGDPNVEIYQAPDGKYHVSTSWAYGLPLKLEIAKAPIRDVVEKVKPRVEEPAQKALEKIGKAVETSLDKSKQVYLDALRATKEELDKLLPEPVKKELENVADKVLRRNQVVKVLTDMNGETKIVFTDRGNVRDSLRYADNGKVVVRQTLKGGKWITSEGLKDKNVIDAVINGQKLLKALRKQHPDKEFIGMAVLDNKGEVWVKIYEVLPTEVSKGVKSGYEFLKKVFSKAEKEGEGVSETPVNINELLSKRDPYEVAVYKLFYEISDDNRASLVTFIKNLPWDKIKDGKYLDALLQNDKYQSLRKFVEDIRRVFENQEQPKTIEELVKEVEKMNEKGESKFTFETEMDVLKRIASKVSDDLSQLERDANYVAGYLLRNMPAKDALEFIIKKVFKGDEKRVEVLKDFVNKVENASKEVSGKIGVEPAEAEKALVDYITNYNAQLKGYSEAYRDTVTRIAEKMLVGEQLKPEEGFALLLREFLGDKEKVKSFLETFKKKPESAAAKAIDELPISDTLKGYLADNLDKIVDGLPKDLDGFIKMSDGVFSKVKSNAGGLSPWESFILKLKELEKSGKISSDRAEKIISTAKKLAEETINNEELRDALGVLSRFMVETVEEKVPAGGLRPFLVKLEDVEKAQKGEEMSVEKTATLSIEKDVAREDKITGTYSVDIETFRKGAKIFNKLLKEHPEELEKLLTDQKIMTQLIEAVARAYKTGNFDFIKEALNALEEQVKEIEEQARKAELKEEVRKAVEQEASVNAGKTAETGKTSSIGGKIGEKFSKLNINFQGLYEKIVNAVKEMREREPIVEAGKEKGGGVKKLQIEENPVEEFDADSGKGVMERLEREFESGRSGGTSETGKGSPVTGKTASLGSGGGSSVITSSGKLELIQVLKEMPQEDVASVFYFLANLPFVKVVEEVGAPQALTGLYNSIAGLGKGALAYGKKVWDVAGKTVETPMIVAIGSGGRNYAIFVPKSDGGNMLVNIRVDRENKATVDIYGDKQSFEEAKPVIRGIIDKLGVKVESASLVPDVSGYGGLDDARLAIKEKAGVVVVDDTVSTRVGNNIVSGNVTGIATPSGARLVYELSGVEGKAGGEVVVTSDGKAEVIVRGSGENARQAEEVGKKIASSLVASPANISVARSGETLLSDVRKDAENVKIIPSGMLKIEEDVDIKMFLDKYGVMPDFVLEIVGKDKERWYLFRKLPEALLLLARQSIDAILGLKPLFEPVVAVAQIPEITTVLQLKTDQVTVTKQNNVPIVKITRPPLIPILIPAPGTAPPIKEAIAEKQNLKQREKLVI
ncbi:MAG: hypothetical protein QW320_04985 [Ignisphaera sp.]